MENENESAPGFPSPQALYDGWSKAMESLEIDRVIALYEEENSVLWGTLANELKCGRTEIKTYFDSFLDRSSLAIDTLDIVYRQPSESIALANGSYAFSLGGREQSDPIVKVEARFSFVFRKSSANAGWLIIDHHSSKFPG